MQQKESAWDWQWQRMKNSSEWLFWDWIAPNTKETFAGKNVLDCGCGGGQHLQAVAPYCRSILGVDLNAGESAKKNTAHLQNISVQEADIAQMNLGRTFDVVYSIGVLHHTNDPTKSFQNIARHCTQGGRVIVWVYAYEGNALNRWLVEPLKSLIVHHLPRPIVRLIAHILTILVYLPVYTLYLFPVGFLPYYEYFQNWRKLKYEHNILNVFDKLNAPQTHFLTFETLKKWFNDDQFTDVSITPYRGVSWRGSGTKKG